MIDPTRWTTETRISEMLAALAGCLCGKIAERNLPTPCYCDIIAGESAYDAIGMGECDDENNGQAWVRLANVYASSSAGQQNVQPGNCATGLGVDIEVGIQRSFPIPDDGSPIEPEEMRLASLLQVADMYAMREAIYCCDALDNEGITLGAWTPIGPTGGLLGGAWTLSVSSDG